MASAPRSRVIAAECQQAVCCAEMTVIASAKSARLGDVQGEVVDFRLPEFHQYASPDHMVSFLLGGTAKIEWKREGRFTRYLSEPGSLTIVPAGDDHAFRTDRRVRALNWKIDPARLKRIADQEWEHCGRKVDLLESSNCRDADLWVLGQRLADLMLAPRPGSRLYAESLDNQIAVHLLWHHSSLTHHDESSGERLTDGRLQRVIDYIHVSLGNEISLDELADIACLSPNYFLSSFKQATGTTPHRYLTEKRIARACELLENPHHSLVSVSLSVGFSSQSHFTTVFRRFMKTTPAAYREQVLRLGPVDLNPAHKDRGETVVPIVTTAKVAK